MKADAEAAAEEEGPPLEPPETPSWRLGRMLARLMFTMFLIRPRLLGRERVDELERPLIAVAPRGNAVDAALLLGWFPDVLRFLLPSDFAEGTPVRGVAERMESHFGDLGSEEARGILAGWLKSREANVGLLVDGPDDLARVAALAAEARCAVVPVRIHGAEEILPEGRWMPTFSRVTVELGEPLLPGGEGPGLLASLEAVLGSGSPPADEASSSAP